MFTFENGKIEDSNRIYQIHTSAIKQLCSTHYGEKEISLWAGKQREETYIPFLEKGDIIVAKKNGNVVGFIHHMESTEDVNGLRVKGLFIDPSFARSGMGRLLMQEVEAIALKKGITIMRVSASLNSLPFYQKMGFTAVEQKLHQITCECAVECVSMVKHLIK